ncbi:MAG: DUF4282 domain-containing protein [Trebonia sp.]
MAGQPPEPAFQPAEQDPGLTQGRHSWQVPPGYASPGGPGPGPGPGQAYAAPGPAYNPPGQAYAAHDQTYTGMGQGYQGYGAQQPQGTATPPPQWQGLAGMKQAGGRTKSRSEAGFIGSLFDFSFNSFVTPKIVRVLYVLATIWTALLALTILIIGFRAGGVAGGIFTLIIIEPLFILLTLGIYRVVLEAFMVVFRIYEETKKIRENSEGQG